jgi:ATP-binding cassette, subfamily B, multidrug efflux pump
MRHFSGDSQDDIGNKLYDKEMFKRLLKYLKPYVFYVVISFVLLFLIVGTELFLPLISKTAVDEVITSDKNLIEFSTKEAADVFAEKYKKIKPKQYEFKADNYIIFFNSTTNFIDDAKLEQVKDEKRFHPQISEVTNNGLSAKLKKQLPSFTISEDKIAFYSKDLKDNEILSAAEMKQLRKKDISKLKYFGLMFFGLVVLQFVFTYFQIYAINYAAQHAMYDLRRELFARLQKMPLSFFDKNPVGRLVTRVTNDVRTLDEMLSSGLVKLIQDFVVLIGIIVMMLILNWKLALVAFSFLPILAFLLITFKNKIRVVYRKVRQKIAAINSTLSEDISGVKIIQLFNRYTRKKADFSEINQEYYKASMKQMRIYASFRPVINSLRRVAVAIIIWYGGGQIIQNAISLGLFMAFLSYIDRFFEPIDHISEKFNILQGAMSGAERIFDLMENPMEKRARSEETGDGKAEFKGEIEFRNVWLQYKENEDVLKDISFKVKAGEKVALVGHTGSGKTSIINLISGMYPFQKGKILIDGNEIDEYSLDELRSNIGIVQQDVFLFSGTIKDNIALNNTKITDEQIQQVSRYVNVDKFIENLPGKYSEPVMERGSTFSVGQRQLIAFARVLAYNPAIFVLDEATSNIDTETEILIQDALKKLMENRTSIIIAHRLSTIQHVDRIIVLHKGEIREEGTHNQLLVKEGLYYDLHRLQYL